MLDTNIVSHAISEPRGAIMRRIGVSLDTIAVSVIVAGELRFGVEWKQSAKLVARVDELLRTVTTLPLPIEADRHYAVLRAQLQRSGLPIGHNDMFIAAHALALGATLVTDNFREFSRVEGLAIENWLRD